MIKRILLMLTSLAALASPIFAQVPPIGPAGCVAAYDQYGNVVPCGFGSALWVVGFGAFIIFITIFLFPRSKTPKVVQQQPKTIQKTLTVQKKGHKVKPIRVWGWGSFLVGVVSIGSIFYELGHIVGPLAILLYFIQQRYGTTWPSILGLLMGFVGFGYQFLDWVLWIYGYSNFGYTMLYVFLGILLLAIFVILSKKKPFIPPKKQKKKEN